MTENKIQELLTRKKKIEKKLKKIEEIFQREKENEEFWPGHASSQYQAAENERHVLLEHLDLIEVELKKLGWRG